MRRKKWLISKADKEFASRASHELGTDPLATLIVTSRGLEDTEELAEFFDDDAPEFFTVEEENEGRNRFDFILLEEDVAPRGAFNALDRVVFTSHLIN